MPRTLRQLHGKLASKMNLYKNEREKVAHNKKKNQHTKPGENETINLMHCVVCFFTGVLNMLEMIKESEKKMKKVAASMDLKPMPI